MYDDDQSASGLLTGAAPEDDGDDVDIDLVGGGDGPPLDRIRDLYMTAESIGDTRLDRHFEQLLARQRQLIREYFADADPPKPAAGPARKDGEPSRLRDTEDLSLGGARRRRR